MDCNNCKDNYLGKIFKKCMKESDIYSEVLEKFDRICLKSEDPRSSLCEECKKYRKYYEEYLKGED